MKSKLAEKIRALELEKSVLLEEVRELREVVELSEKAKSLESEVDRLRSEVRALRGRLPREFLEEIGELAGSGVSEEEESECSGCEEELL